MGTLGLITCEMLELEFAWLLAGDPDVQRIAIVENARSRRFVEALERHGRSGVESIPHPAAFRPEPMAGLEVVVRVLEAALHRCRSVLRKALRETTLELSPHVDALMLGYGLCGNALENPRESLDVGVPIFIPMDGAQPVDDCVGMLLGDRERYLAQQLQVPGTFFMTPEWTVHWKVFFGQDCVVPDDTLMKRIFQGYERVLLIETPVMSLETMRRNIEAFRSRLGLRVETCVGTLNLLRAAWEAAKGELIARPDRES